MKILFKPFFIYIFFLASSIYCVKSIEGIMDVSYKIIETCDTEYFSQDCSSLQNIAEEEYELSDDDNDPPSIENRSVFLSNEGISNSKTNLYKKHHRFSSSGKPPNIV